MCDRQSHFRAGFPNDGVCKIFLRCQGQVRSSGSRRYTGRTCWSPDERLFFTAIRVVPQIVSDLSLRISSGTFLFGKKEKIYIKYVE